MTKSNHTALYVRDEKPNDFTFSNGSLAGTVYPEMDLPGYKSSEKAKNEAEEFVALIVHRVNNWDKLVEVIETAIREAMAIKSAENRFTCKELGGRIADRLKQALSLAKEGK